MPQANFAYASPANDPAGLPLAISIYADRVHLRDQLREDAEAAGFRIAAADDLAALLEGEPRALGQLVVLDCPCTDGATLAALARIDMRAAHCGARLIVATSVAALDDVFACMDQSDPLILVDPTRAERVVALGRALADMRGSSLRELGEEDRLMLLRLSEQVNRIAERLERLSPASPASAPPAADRGFHVASPGRDFSSKGDDDSERALRATRPPLPDPRLLRRIIRQRQLRARFFDGDLFADPAWDILLDLTAARAEHRRVSVTSLCIASGVPPTTALRWIGQMTEGGLLQRVEDETDRRRAFIALTDKAADAMARFFAEAGKGAERLV